MRNAPSRHFAFRSLDTGIPRTDCRGMGSLVKKAFTRVQQRGGRAVPINNTKLRCVLNS